MLAVIVAPLNPKLTLLELLNTMLCRFELEPSPLTFNADSSPAVLGTVYEASSDPPLFENVTPLALLKFRV